MACILAVLTVGIFAVVNPYSDPNDHRAYTLGALVIFLTMFMGLVVKVTIANSSSRMRLDCAGLGRAAVRGRRFCLSSSILIV